MIDVLTNVSYPMVTIKQITIKQINIIYQYRVLNTSKEILLFVKRVGIPLLQFQAALRGTFSPDDNVVSDDEE